MIALVLGCAGGVPADAGQEVSRCASGEDRSEALLDIPGFVYVVDGEEPLSGVEVGVCGADRPATRSGADGTWTLSGVADTEWTTLELSLEGSLPVRALIDTAVEGNARYTFRTGLTDTVSADAMVAALGLSLEPGTGIVDVCVTDDETGHDLAGAVVDISSDYEAAFIRDASSGEFVFARETNGLYDVVFLNVQPGPVELYIEHPTRPTCRVTPEVLVEADAVLNLNGYCRG